MKKAFCSSEIASPSARSSRSAKISGLPSHRNQKIGVFPRRVPVAPKVVQGVHDVGVEDKGDLRRRASFPPQLGRRLEEKADLVTIGVRVRHVHEEAVHPGLAQELEISPRDPRVHRPEVTHFRLSPPVKSPVRPEAFVHRIRRQNLRDIERPRRAVVAVPNEVENADESVLPEALSHRQLSPQAIRRHPCIGLEIAVWEGEGRRRNQAEEHTVRLPIGAER